MKKNYIAPETQVNGIATAQMICGSVGISNTTTSTQWSRDGGYWDDEDDGEFQ